MESVRESLWCSEYVVIALVVIFLVAKEAYTSFRTSNDHKI